MIKWIKKRCKRASINYQIKQCVRTINIWELKVEELKHKIEEMERKIESEENPSKKTINNLHMLYAYMNDCECAIIHAKHTMNELIEDLKEYY